MEFLSNLPGAVWGIMGVVVLIVMIFIASYGNSEYGLRMLFSWNMPILFFSIGLSIGSFFYYDSYAQESVQPENLMINTSIMLVGSVVLLCYAYYRNAKKSNYGFATIYTAVQFFFSTLIVLSVACIFNRKSD